MNYTLYHDIKNVPLREKENKNEPNEFNSVRLFTM